MLDQVALYFFNLIDSLVSHFKSFDSSLILFTCNLEAGNRQTSEFELLAFGLVICPNSLAAQNLEGVFTLEEVTL